MRALLVQERISAYVPGAGLMTISVLFRISFLSLVKYISRSIDSHMTTWKVIETVRGNIEAVSGPEAQRRPGQHEFLVWEGEATDKTEVLKCA
jgi:hypothetical protein